MPERNLPAVVEGGELEDGDTAVHRHPEAQDIWQLAKLLRLDTKDGGMTVKEMRDVLVIEWPDLEVTPEELGKFLERYVDPHVVVTPEFYRKGLMKANSRLNAAAAIAEVAERMQKRWEEEERNVGRVLDYDSKGDPIFGPTVKDWVDAGKKVIEARRQQMEEQARIGMAPERKGASQGNVNVVVAPQVKVDLREAVGTGFSRGKPIDADFKSKDSGPGEQ